MGGLPPFEELAKDSFFQDDPVSAVFVDQLINAKSRAYGPKYNDMSAEIRKAVGTVLSGGAAPQDALTEAAQVINSFLGQ